MRITIQALNVNPLILIGLVAAAACQRDAAVHSSDVTLDSTVSALESIRDSMPAFYHGMHSLYVVGAQIALNDLGFSVGAYSGELDQATLRATADYERARGLPITGNPLSKTTFRRLTTEGERIHTASPPSTRLFEDGAWRDGAFAAQGPWIALGVDIPAGIRIQCERARRECVLAESEIPPSGPGAELGLVPTIDSYEIASWDDAEIRSTPTDNACFRTVLIINRLEQSVDLQRTTLGTGRFCDALTKDPSVVYNRPSHLATATEILQSSAHQAALIFDTLLNITPSLQRTLRAFRDTTRIRQQSRHE